MLGGRFIPCLKLVLSSFQEAQIFLAEEQIGVPLISLLPEHHRTCSSLVDVLDENQSKLSEDLMEFRRDASMLNVRRGWALGCGRDHMQLPGSAAG